MRYKLLSAPVLSSLLTVPLDVQFGAKRALELATNARASLEDALEDAGIKAGSEQATRAVVSAWAGAKGAVLVRRRLLWLPSSFVGYKTICYSTSVTGKQTWHS